MSNTIILHQTRQGVPELEAKSLWYEQRTAAEHKALRLADGYPVISHDIDYPHAEVLGPIKGEITMSWQEDVGFPWTEMCVDDDRTVELIVALGGTVWTELSRRYKHVHGHVWINDGRRVWSTWPGSEIDKWMDEGLMRTSRVQWSLPRQLDPYVVDQVFGRLRPWNKEQADG